MLGEHSVLRVADVGIDTLARLLERYGLTLVLSAPGEEITGSFWGDSEAGIVGTTVYVRDDTPVHSLLHETCHVICMDRDRRRNLTKDAGGDDLEEAAVCYMQILLADQIVGFGKDRAMCDMDAWGYSFRLGSTERWFHDDADDARELLLSCKLITDKGEPTFALRN